MNFEESSYQEIAKEMSSVFQQAGWNVELYEPNYARIERVANRAMFENVMKDTTTFVFVSFGTAVHSLVGAVFGAVSGDNTIDYKV